VRGRKCGIKNINVQVILNGPAQPGQYRDVVKVRAGYARNYWCRGNWREAEPKNLRAFEPSKRSRRIAASASAATPLAIRKTRRSRFPPCARG